MKELNYSELLFLHELREIVGRDNVITDLMEKKSQKIDLWWITRFAEFNNIAIQEPLAIVFPEDKEQVSSTVKLCNRYKIPVVPRAGGANDSGGTLPICGGIVLDVKKMDKILYLDEKSLTVRAQPGILQQHLEEQLNRKGYTMNHLPASIHTSALGGFISTNGTGILSSKYGKLTDMVRQLEVVLPNGRLFKTMPVTHHSAGPDYTKLFIGAEGTMGIIVEALVNIHPLPEKREFAAYLLPDLSDGIEAGRKIMVNGLMASILRLYDQNDTNNILKRVYHLEGEGCYLLIGFDGMAPVVDAQMDVAREIIEKAGGKALGAEQGWDWWNHRLRSYYPPTTSEPYFWSVDVTDTVASYEDIEKVYYAMKSAVEDGFREYGATFQAHFSHWYNWGTSFYPVFTVKDVPEDREEAIELFHRLEEACVRAAIHNNGAVNEHHGTGIKRSRFIREAYGEGFEMIQTLKNAMDKNNIMNPGKLGFDL